MLKRLSARLNDLYKLSFLAAAGLLVVAAVLAGFGVFQVVLPIACLGIIAGFAAVHMQAMVLYQSLRKNSAAPTVAQPTINKQEVDPALHKAAASLLAEARVLRACALKLEDSAKLDV